MSSRALVSLFNYGRHHKFWAFCVLVFTFLVLYFCLEGLYLAFVEQSVAAQYALIAGMVGFAATAAGSLPGFFMHKLSDRTENIMLGAAAGMMLSAAFFSLLEPALESSEKLFTNPWLAALWVVFGMALGVALLLGVDAMTPHEHLARGHEGPDIKAVSGIWLFVFAIIIHNFPEGMALGISFAAENLSIGIPFTAAIALQDMPEGLAVVLALRAAGVNSSKAVGVGIASGIMEPVGALLGVSITSQLGFAYPLGLALSAGAMIFVVSHEVIPETHRGNHPMPATLGLMIGFCIMMVLDVVLS